MLKALLLAMPDTTQGSRVLMSLPSLGLASIAGNVDASICDVRIADLLVAKGNLEHLVAKLLRQQSPDVVGLSCLSFQYRSALRIAQWVKAYDPGILVVMGGYHPTLMYQEIALSPASRNIDFIVRGEGEATFRELMTAIDASKGYEGISGLSYKLRNEFHHNPPGDLLPLSEIQLPNRNARLFQKGFQGVGLPADAIETSRGCMNCCRFCCIREMYGRSFRTYEISRVIADIQDAYRCGARWLMVTDDNITLNVRRLEMLCDEIAAAKLNSIHYCVQASVAGINHSEKLVQKMVDAGVRAVFMGIETVSRERLHFLGKGAHTFKDTQRAVDCLHDHGIICSGGFIVGYPDDDKETLWDAFHTARELKLDMPLFGVLTPFPKTEIREELMTHGLVTNPDDFSSYGIRSANIRTHHLTQEEIKRIVEDMWDRYYVNLGWVWSNRIRKVYRSYFWRTVAKQGVQSVLARMNFLSDKAKRTQ